MNAEQFAYWLQGFTELTEGAQPTPEQWKSINDHLKTVFVKVTPQVGTPARHLTPLEDIERFFARPLGYPTTAITC